MKNTTQIMKESNEIRKINRHARREEMNELKRSLDYLKEEVQRLE